MKTHLSSLVDRVCKNGEPFIIAKAGKAMVKVVPIDAPDEGSQRRLGFLEGKAEIPEDFDTMGSDEVESDFYK